MKNIMTQGNHANPLCLQLYKLSHYLIMYILCILIRFGRQRNCYLVLLPLPLLSWDGDCVVGGCPRMPPPFGGVGLFGLNGV